MGAMRPCGAGQLFLGHTTKLLLLCLAFTLILRPVSSVGRGGVVHVRTGVRVTLRGPPQPLRASNSPWFGLAFHLFIFLDELIMISCR